MKKDNKEAKETKKNLKDQKTNSDKRIKNSGFIDMQQLHKAILSNNLLLLL